MAGRRFLLLVFQLSVGAFFLGCTPAERGVGTDDVSLRVVSTTAMIGNLVGEILGPDGISLTLMGSGIDPHLYSPTRRDVLLLDGADLIFYNGAGLEGRMGDVLRSMARRGRLTYPVADLVLASGRYEPAIDPEDADAFDPHIWMDVRAWMEVALLIRDTLIAAAPALSGAFSERTEVLLETLGALDTYARTMVTSIPEAQRVLITAHDAFGYFGRAYGIEVMGIQGMSTESEAGLRDIELLIYSIVEREIPAIFLESSVPDRNVRAVMEGARARGHTLRLGGTLFSDAMGPEGTYEGTYVGMIDHNVTTLVRALGGTAPEGGFREWRERTAVGGHP